MALSFTWTGTNTGVWGDASHWTDVTSVPAPATAPPGGSDEVALTGGTHSLLVVNGPGQADTLTLAGQVELNGTFNVGSLVQSGTFAMLTGSLIAAAGATITGFVDQVGGGLMANGLAINGGSLEVDPGAFVEIGSDGTADGSDGLVVDANAVVTVTGGWLSVGSVLNHGSILATGSTGSPLSGNNGGLISGLSVDTIVNAGTLESGAGQAISAGNVTGGGEIDVSAGGTVMITQGVTGTVRFLDATGTLMIDASSLASDALGIQGFAGGDVITLGSDVSAISFSPNGWGDGTLTATTGSGSFMLDIQGDYDSGQTVSLLSGGTAQVGQGLALPCFATGTRIMTRHGEVVVEALRPGDEVATLLPQGFRPVRWIGCRTIRLAGHPRPLDVQPVRVRAHAFGPGLPTRDLLLSPDHALYAEGVLVPVKHLVNGDTVARQSVEAVTYWHVELDRHDVLLAEGLPAESYLDTGDRACFADGGAIATLHPKFGALTWDAQGCAPLTVTGPVLERLRTVLRKPATMPVRRPTRAACAAARPRPRAA